MNNSLKTKILLDLSKELLKHLIHNITVAKDHRLICEKKGRYLVANGISGPLNM